MEREEEEHRRRSLGKGRKPTKAITIKTEVKPPPEGEGQVKGIVGAGNGKRL